MIFCFISAQNIDWGYLLELPRRGSSNEYPQSMFLSRNKKNNVYPCKPQFCYIKVGFKGVKLYRYIFVMIQNAPSEDSHQTAPVLRLVWIFTGCICPKKCFLTLWLTAYMFLHLKAPYSSKTDIFFIKKRFNKLTYIIKTIIKCGIWQPVKFQLVSCFWTGSKMKWFFIISELMLANLIQEIHVQ